MKLLKAIIQPSKVESVKKALLDIGIQGLNVSRLESYARDRARKQVVRAREYAVDFVPMATFETVIEDEMVDAAVKAITEAARSGRPGDGRIFLSDISEAINIRTGITGVDAITRVRAPEARGAA